MKNLNYLTDLFFIPDIQDYFEYILKNMEKKQLILQKYIFKQNRK